MNKKENNIHIIPAQGGAWRATARRPLLLLAMSGTLLSFCAGYGWAFDTRQPQNQAWLQQAPVPAKSANAMGDQFSSSPVRTDACFPLLRSIRPSPPSATIATDRSQRSAGKAAALGLVFGVRYALQPVKIALDPSEYGRKEQKEDRSITANRKAQAIADYRHCQKSNALSVQAMDDLRWMQ